MPGMLFLIIIVSELICLVSLQSGIAFDNCTTGSGIRPNTAQLDTTRLTLGPSGVLYTRGTQFEILLYRNGAGDKILKVTCMARLYTSLMETNMTADCKAGGNSTNPALQKEQRWELEDDLIEFKSKETIKRVIVERTSEDNIPSPPVELVKVSCCAQSNDTDLDAYILVHVQLAKSHTLVNNPTGRKKENPAFVELAPCPCDLTTDECDLHCCCDSDCNGDIGTLFTKCQRGVHGGRADLETFRCASDHHDRPDWFPVLCVHSEINALLGKFYTQTETTLTSSSDIAARLKSKKTGAFTFHETDSRAVDDVMDKYPGNYSYGEIIKTGKPWNNWDGVQDIRGVFSLPQKVLNGECLDNAPVRFLKPVDSFCNYKVTKDSCEDNPVFDANNFPVSTATNLKCTFYILGSGSAIVSASVKYLCANFARSDMSARFVKSGGETLDVAKSYLFRVNDSCPTEPIAPPQCTDQSVARPVFDSTTEKCTNVVLATRFTMKWRVGSVKYVSGEITLGSVTEGNTITQHHSVEYVDNVAPNDTERRSGNPGMDIGAAPQSGRKGPRSISMSDEDRLRLIKADASGLCLQAGCRDVEFGYDATSSCTIRLSMHDFTSCPDLKEKVVKYLDGLMPADSLGRFGHNDPRQLGVKSWKVIHRQNISEHFTQEFLPVEKTTDGQNVSANYTQDFQSGENTTQGSPGLPSVCVNVTSGIHLDVLYAVSGRSHGVPTYEIMGARINYTLSLWRLSCPSCRDTRPPNGSRPTEDFTLTTSVRFILVPAQTPPRVTKYRKYHNDSVCRYETCWREFMYPLSPAFTGDPPGYTLALVCVVILVFLFYFAVTLPWW